MPSAPEVLFALDHPTHHPVGATVTVDGWVAAGAAVERVRVLRPDGGLSEPLPLVERPDIRRLHPDRAHVTGFSARLPANWAADGEIGIAYAVGGHEHRFRRALPHAIDMDAKSRKLRRIAPLLRPDRAGRITAYHFDCLTDELRRDHGLDEVDAVSRNHYDGIALDLIRRHADGLVLDAGAGCRDVYLPNVVNLEIAPYPSTDVLAAGEELPFLDHSFDAVLSLAVLEHVRDPFRCARELARVLKPGGTLYAAVPFLQPYHGYPHHYYNMTHQGLANLFAGLLEVKQQTVLPSGAPIWTLWWFLRSYLAGLPPAEAARFRELKVSDFLGEPETLLGRPFVTQLAPATQLELAAATMLIAVSPPAAPEAKQ